MYTIKTKDGKSYKGAILTMDKERVLLDSGVNFQHDEIESITVPEDIYNLFQIDNTRLESLMPVEDDGPICDPKHDDDFEFGQLEGKPIDWEKLKRDKQKDWPNDPDPTSNWPESPYGY